MINKIHACFFGGGATMMVYLKTECDLSTQQVICNLQEIYGDLQMNIKWIKYNGKKIIDNTQNDNNKSEENHGG